VKVLFLDIDGVLNSHQWAVSGGGYGHAMRDRPPSVETLQWDPVAVRNLRNIIEATGAQIVVSSSWRGFGRNARTAWQAMFACYGWPDAPVIGETPDLNRMEGGIYVSKIRGDEVAAWLEAHPEVERYVCLDDDSDFRPDQPLVKTDGRFGLTMIEASQCRRLLEQPLPGGEK
jgi:hypothetical protein